jgi:hypothetical protein
MSCSSYHSPTLLYVVSILLDRALDDQLTATIVYTNSFMAALNMRPYLKHNHRAAFEDTLPVTIGAASAQAWSTSRGYANGVSHMPNMSGGQVMLQDTKRDRITEIAPTTLDMSDGEKHRASPVAEDKVLRGWA